jgi:peptidoglycan-associated lipoprotein
MKKSVETMRRAAVPLVSMTMLAASLLAAQTKQVAGPQPAGGAEFAVTYAAQRSIVTGPGNGFWLQGAAADASVPVYRDLSLAASLTFGHSGNTGGAGSSLDVVTMVAGPRFTWQMRPTVSKPRASLFAEGLFGVAHGFNSIFPEGSTLASSASSFALMTGGGIDVPLSRWVGVRLLQVDYIRTSLPNGDANVQNSFRVAAGIRLSLSGLHHRNN